MIFVPLRAAERRFSEAEATVLYVRAKPGERDAARVELEAVLRRLRRLAPDEPNDFELSTADQIIGTLDQVSAAIGLATFALAAVSLLIGGIGIANVMIIAVTERTREIGVRRALGARRAEVLRQFLLEAAFLSGTGGLAGVLVASLARLPDHPGGPRLLRGGPGLGRPHRPRRIRSHRHRGGLPARPPGGLPRPRGGAPLRVRLAWPPARSPSPPGIAAR